MKFWIKDVLIDGVLGFVFFVIPWFVGYTGILARIVEELL